MGVGGGRFLALRSDDLFNEAVDGSYMKLRGVVSNQSSFTHHCAAADGTGGVGGGSLGVLFAVTVRLLAGHTAKNHLLFDVVRSDASA